MKVLGIAAQKGGVGKTTFSLHLAGIASNAGLKVAVIDVDKQSSAAGWSESRESEQPLIVSMQVSELSEAIKGAANDGFDLVVVDSAPNHGSDIAEVARLSDFVVIPTKPSALDLPAIKPTIEIVKAVGGQCMVALNACPVGRSGFDASITTEARAYIKELGADVFNQAITVRAALSHALIGGELIHEYEPRGKAHKELKQLWKEIEAAL